MTKTTYNYLIRIKPLDYYFFGGETTFGDGKNQNYYAKTRPFPQQTTILGVLRHLGYGKDKVDIGESFDADTLISADNSFGYIKDLSPLFLMKGGKHYLPSPLGTEKGLPYDVSAAGEGLKQWNGESWEQAYQLLDYKAKEGWNQRLRSKDDDKAIELEDVIKIFDKIGINKNHKNDNENTDGFYKQQMAKLDKGWEFAVLAKLDKKQTDQLPQSATMPFGAEKALFHLDLKQLENEIELDDYFPDSLWKHTFPEKLACVLLLSDALADKEIYKYCQFAITDTVDFRNIRTSQNVKEFARYSKHKKMDGKIVDYLYKSGKYNLLKRGSLLYGDEEKIKECIDRSAYQAIGYNHYTILSSTKK